MSEKHPERCRILRTDALNLLNELRSQLEPEDVPSFQAAFAEVTACKNQYVTMSRTDETEAWRFDVPQPAVEPCPGDYVARQKPMN